MPIDHKHGTVLCFRVISGLHMQDAVGTASVVHSVAHGIDPIDGRLEGASFELGFRIGFSVVHCVVHGLDAKDGRLDETIFE